MRRAADILAGLHADDAATLLLALNVPTRLVLMERNARIRRLAREMSGSTHMRAVALEAELRNPEMAALSRQAALHAIVRLNGGQPLARRQLHDILTAPAPG